MSLEYIRAVRDAVRPKPNASTQTAVANLCGQPLHAVRKVLIAFPVSVGAEPAGIDLDILQAVGLQHARREVGISRHFIFVDVLVRVVPAAPSIDDRVQADLLDVGDRLRIGFGAVNGSGAILKMSLPEVELAPASKVHSTL